MEVGNRDARPPLAGNALLDLAFHIVAVIFVRRDVDDAGLRVIGLERPVLAAPQARAELRGLAGARLVRHIDVRAAGLRIDALEDVLRDIGFGVQVGDAAVAVTPQPVEVAVALRRQQALGGRAVLLEIHQHRRVHRVPVPGLVLMVLEMPLDLAGVAVQRHGRGRVEIVARPLIAEPGGGVAGAPIDRVGVGS